MRAAGDACIGAAPDLGHRSSGLGLRGKAGVKEVFGDRPRLERLAAENRDSELVCLVSSDAVVRRVSGQEVRKLSSRLFLRERTSVTMSEMAKRPPDFSTRKTSRSITEGY